ncbi:MAG: ABC transporter permease [Geminicoccaceae bacterium]
MIRLVPRAEPSAAWSYLAPVLAVALTVIAGFVLFALMGYDPLETLYHFFVSPLSTRYGLAELVVKATPLVLIGVGLSIGFRAGVWNIGAEGQLTLGAVFGGGLAIAFHESDSMLLLPAMLVMGALGGALWAAIPAFLKTRFNVNEILTSLMLTYVATLLLSALVHGPWRDPDGYNFPEARLFPDAGTMPILLDGTRLHLGALLAVVAVAAAWFMLSRTILGFHVKVVGAAPRAARFAGFSDQRMVWFCMLLAGGLAGLAGLGEVAGPTGQLVPEISPGYGFTAIIVAFLGRLHPLGVLFAGLLMALSYLGGENAQIAVGLPTAATGVFQGMLLFFVLAADLFVRYRLAWASGTLPGAGRAEAS